MENPKKGMLSHIFGPAATSYYYVKNQLSKHLGYDVAKRGWDNNSPMSEYPKLQELKEVFQKHTTKERLTWNVISPLLWSDMIVDAAKVFAPKRDSELLPKFQYDTTEEDLKRFKPDKNLHRRLLESTAHTTGRSFWRSFFKVMGMYWTKAGVKEVGIASTLAFITIYTANESVGVLADFSNWGRGFYDFFVNAGGDSETFKNGVMDAMRSAFDLNPYSSITSLIDTITNSGTQFDLSAMDLTQSLSNLKKIDPAVISEIISNAGSQLGTDELGRVALDQFATEEGRNTLEEIIKATGIEPKQRQEILDAVIQGYEVKSSAIEMIGQLSDKFGSESLSEVLHYEQQQSLLSRTLGAFDISPEERQGIIGMVMSGQPLTGVDPQITNSIQEALGTLSLHSEELVQRSNEVKQNFDYIMAEHVLNATSVKSNSNYLLTTVPKEFSGLLGKFLLYILPSIYTAAHLALRWETWMTGKISNEWLKYKSAYQLRFRHTNIDNPDQRIEENLSQITDFVIDTTTDGIQNYLKLATFLPMLGAMGSFNPAFLGGPDIEIKDYLSWSALGYAAIGTGILGAITWNLPALQRQIQKVKAHFRASLISVNSQPEQISLTNGEEQEKKVLKDKFDDVIDVKKRVINKNMQIRTWNSIHGNIGSYVPFILAAPQYFAGIITFGQVSQAMGIFRTVEGSFEFVKNMIVPFTNFKAGLDRTAQMIDAIDLARYEELERRYYMREAEKTGQGGQPAHASPAPAAPTPSNA